MPYMLDTCLRYLLNVPMSSVFYESAETFAITFIWDFLSLNEEDFIAKKF